MKNYAMEASILVHPIPSTRVSIDFIKNKNKRFLDVILCTNNFCSVKCSSDYNNIFYWIASKLLLSTKKNSQT